MSKLENLKAHNTTTDVDLRALMTQIEAMHPKYKSYFLLPERDKLIPLQVSNIAYVCIEDRKVKMVTFDKKLFLFSAIFIYDFISA